MGEASEGKNIIREYSLEKKLDGKIDFIKMRLDPKHSVYISEKILNAALAYSHFQTEKGLVHLMQNLFDEPDVVLQGPDQATVFKKRVYGRKRGQKFVQLMLGAPLYIFDFAKKKPGVYYIFNLEVHLRSDSVCEKIVEEMYENTLQPNFKPISYDMSSPRLFSKPSKGDVCKNRLFVRSQRQLRRTEVAPEKTVSIIGDYSDSDDEFE